MTDNDTLYLLARIETKLDILLGYRDKPDEGSRISAAETGFLRSLTRRQHITFQALVGGWKNSEIGDALGVNVNTAKLHVRTVCQKLGVRNRTEAATAGASLLSRIEPTAYKAISGGIPPDWHTTAPRDGSDPLRALYTPTRKKAAED